MRSDTLPRCHSMLLSGVKNPFFIILILSVFFGTNTVAQHGENKIAQEIQYIQGDFAKTPVSKPFDLHPGRSAGVATAQAVLPEALFYSVSQAEIDQIMNGDPALLKLDWPVSANENIRLQLKKANIFTSSFQVFTASDPESPFPYEKGRYFWGIVENDPHSLVALAFTRGEVMGFIQRDGQLYTFGKLDNETTHILYRTDDLPLSGVDCFVDESHDLSNGVPHTAGSRDANNCVKMYVQVDYDVFVGKGGVQQAADYVNGAFSQVAIMYANESIDFTINELFVWNVADPFTGPTTSNYLSQFRSYLNGNFNGDLAHLVGYNGGGGIAYLDVLCNAFNGVGYSAVNPTYANVPTYSWTVMVLTHEIGHNLGSPHTHACAWNGNNTAIDGCGPAAGYSEGCNAPLPPQGGGTVMSYCHLIGSVGIGMTNGFGPQPGDRIRAEVYNASCLSACGPPVQFDAGITAINAPVAYPCENSVAPIVVLKNFGAAPLTAVTISRKLDNGSVQNYNWTGNLTQQQSTTVTLPAITYGTGPHTLNVYTVNPNGNADEVPSNDASSVNFTYHVDWCTCNASTASIVPNPLTHTGNGSHSASVSFEAGSKRPVFTISGLNQKVNGQQSSRFVDVVTVTYIDGYGANKTYGTFSAAQQSSVNVNIVDLVSSVQISLSNGLGNNGYSGTQSVSFTQVDYCGDGTPCEDLDNDQICDDVDSCPNFNNNLIGTSCNDNDPCTENDVYTVNCNCAGTPISNCGEGCNEVSSTFTPNPLTHTGTGSSQALVNIPAGNTDVTFTISGLSAQTNGNPNNRYIEEVTVRYVNGAGATLTYGVFRGDQVSTVNVAIAGSVQSVTLLLTDAYDGNTNTTLSISMTSVTSCASGNLPPAESIGSAIHQQVSVYPNPTSGQLYIQWEAPRQQTDVIVYNAIGEIILSQSYSDVLNAQISIDNAGIQTQQLLFVRIVSDEDPDQVFRILLIR